MEILIFLIIVGLLLSLIYKFENSKLIDSFSFEGYDYLAYDDTSYFKESVYSKHSIEITEWDYNYAKDRWRNAGN